MAILKVFTMCLQPWKKILFCLPFFSAVQGETIWHQAPGKTARVLSPHAWWSRRSLRTWSLLLPYRRCPSLGPSHSFPVVLTLQCIHTYTNATTQTNEEIFWWDGNHEGRLRRVHSLSCQEAAAGLISSATFLPRQRWSDVADCHQQ